MGVVVRWVTRACRFDPAKYAPRFPGGGHRVHGGKLKAMLCLCWSGYFFVSLFCCIESVL